MAVGWAEVGSSSKNNVWILGSGSIVDLVNDSSYCATS
ncbi:hypothetical protein PF004_g11267 [Phytophthora fragariae]|uniref:Uncharacterized protein n=1 Tax=Phytophthora fragariae TaxID=53985 RepID=A0A6A3K5M4_9STRA|nr:hypothetical protein PF011_g14001 [Phytophthora fragariae]KAE9227761.1 hypothetical protein PF004_g11267 [Phytophthora fragariae]